MPVYRLDSYDAELAARTTAADWARIAGFRDRPDFLDGVRSYYALMPSLFVNSFIMNKLVPEAFRFQMLVFALHLHDTRDPAVATSGLTLSSLQRICAAQGIAAPGRVAAFLSLMRLGGYLTRVRSVADTRVVLLEPTGNFIATVERWNEAILKTIDAAAPSDDLWGQRALHPRLGWEMRRYGAETLLAGWQPLLPFPEVALFVARDGGWILLTHCVVHSLTAEAGQFEPVSVDLNALSVQYGISRSQLRGLLQAAHAAGLLDAPPHKRGQVLVSERLVCVFLAWLASYLENFQRCALTALAGLRCAAAANGG